MKPVEKATERILARMYPEIPRALRFLHLDQAYNLVSFGSEQDLLPYADIMDDLKKEMEKPMTKLQPPDGTVIETQEEAIRVLLSPEYVGGRGG